MSLYLSSCCCAGVGLTAAAAEHVGQQGPDRGGLQADLPERKCSLLHSASFCYIRSFLTTALCICVYVCVCVLNDSQLVDEQRKYFKAVKDFQDECNKNDWLSAKLEQITRQQ